MVISRLFHSIDTHKAQQLLIGVIGVNIAFLIAGIQYQKITNNKYLNQQNNQYQLFRITSGFIFIERFLTWIFGLIYKQITQPIYQKQKKINIPIKNSLSTAFIIYLSSITQTQSMYFVSYPLIIMTKSCSLLNVILVGIFCSKVTHKQLKLGYKKIIIAIAVTVGILMFRFFDPNISLNDNSHKTQLVGIILLLISLIADGFIPDFQAQIKQKYKPSPIDMLITINKWCSICALVHMIITGQIFTMLAYCLDHQLFMYDLLIQAVTAFIGQIFIYRMIKQFKQHIVPFVVTTRKILTVGLSLIYFHHQTNLGQVTSIVIVLMATVYQFSDSIQKTPIISIENSNDSNNNENININKDEIKDMSICELSVQQQEYDREIKQCEQNNPNNNKISEKINNKKSKKIKQSHYLQQQQHDNIQSIQLS